MQDPIHTFLSYIKTKTVMSFRLKPSGEEQQQKWVHISDKQIEQDFLRYDEGYVRKDVIYQLEQEGAIKKRKAEGIRPYNVYQLLPEYWDIVDFDIDLVAPPPAMDPMHQTMTDHLRRVYIDIDSYAEVLTPDYLAYFQQFLKYRNSNYLTRFVTVCDFAHRFHSPITNLNRKVRPNITLDYEPTIGLDVATMQPTILASILEKYIPGNWFSKVVWDGLDIYVHLQEKAGKSTRDEGKKLFFELAFAPASEDLVNMFGAAPWVDWINKVKRADNPKNPHNGTKRYSNMAWLLQTNEVRIMQEVWKSHISEAIPFVTVHDEIIAKRSDAAMSENLIRTVLDKEFKNYKLNTKL